jgi:hypothetical protein
MKREVIRTVSKKNTKKRTPVRKKKGSTKGKKTPRRR